MAGWLAAAERTGDVAPAMDRVTTLERYIERHEALFGDGEHALPERGQVCELLFELEQRLGAATEDSPAGDPEDADPPPTALTLDAEFVFFVQGAQYAAEWNGGPRTRPAHRANRSPEPCACCFA